MPADTSKAAAAAAAARRRNNLRRDAEDIKYDSSHAREIELKRSRGEISCAECRRCDHRVLSPPCLRFTLVRSSPQAQGLYHPLLPADVCLLASFSRSSAIQIRCDKTIPCQSCQVCTPRPSAPRPYPSTSSLPRSVADALLFVQMVRIQLLVWRNFSAG